MAPGTRNMVHKIKKNLYCFKTEHSSFIFKYSMQHQDITELLMQDNSRTNTDFVGGFVRQKPELINELWEIYLSEREPVSRRAAWIIDTVSENNPGWIQPYMTQLINKLPGFKHDGLKRHGLRMISRCPIPEEKVAELVNICFEWLLSPSEAVAAKFYCMNILYDISQQLPEMKHELIDSIEFQLPEGTPGFKSIGKKILTKLYQEVGR